MFKDYYTHYFYYYAHYFYWLTRIPVAVITSYAQRTYMHRFCLSQQAEGTSGKLPFPSEAPKLFCFFAIILHYITIIAIFFQLFALFQKQKSLSGLEFVTDNRPIASSNSEHHGGTLFVASRSGVDSILDRQDAFSHNRAGICRVVLWVRTTDV